MDDQTSEVFWARWLEAQKAKADTEQRLRERVNALEGEGLAVARELLQALEGERRANQELRDTVDQHILTMANMARRCRALQLELAGVAKPKSKPRLVANG
jgi:hypothetical protein